MRHEASDFGIAQATMATPFVIKDLGNHSRETIDTLRALLADGAGARPDSKRPHLYEFESETCVFYVHVSPVNGVVELLATWPRVEEPALCH